MIKTLVVAAALLVSTSVAAQSWNASFNIGGGILTFGVTGTLQADGNTVFVTSLNNPAFNGTPGPALPFLTSATGYLGTPAPTTLSLNGANLDLYTCQTSDCVEGFAFLPESLFGFRAFASGAFYGNAYGGIPFVQANWSMTSAQAPGAVPEPASWAMLIAGFGLIGAMARRRRMAVARAA